MTHHSHHHSTGKNLLALALVGAIAATLGVIFAPKSGEEIRDDISEKAKDLMKKFKESRSEIKERVTDIFGEFRDDLERKYIEMRAEIMANAEDMEDMTREKYEQIVDNVVDEFAQGNDWSGDAGKKLKKNFKRHWEE